MTPGAALPEMPPFLTRKDFAAGLLLTAFGVAALVLGGDLPLGSARRMGPGYVPFGLAILLIAIGAVIAATSLVAGGETIERPRARPLVGVLAGGVAFALLVGTGGILLATAGAILGGAVADRSTRWGEAAILAVACAAFSAVVFVELLAVPMPLWFR